jgi:hypothetical protein
MGKSAALMAVKGRTRGEVGGDMITAFLRSVFRSTAY